MSIQTFSHICYISLYSFSHQLRGTPLYITISLDNIFNLHRIAIMNRMIEHRECPLCNQSNQFFGETPERHFAPASKND